MTADCRIAPSCPLLSQMSSSYSAKPGDCLSLLSSWEEASMVLELSVLASMFEILAPIM